MNSFTTSWGAFDLARFPEDPRDTLRAWDAADAYLLRHLAGAGAGEGDDEAKPTDLTGTVALVGDRWGALTTALAGHARVVQITDSFLTRQATRANLARNGIEEAGPAAALDQGHAARSDRRPADPRPQEPRAPGGPAAPPRPERARRYRRRRRTGMVTEIHTSTLQLFERIIGPTRTSLAENKARLDLLHPRPPAGRTPESLAAQLPRCPADTGPARRPDRRQPCGDLLAPNTSTSAPGSSCAPPPAPPGRARASSTWAAATASSALAAALGSPQAGADLHRRVLPGGRLGRATFRANAPADARAEFRVGDGLSGVPPVAPTWCSTTRRSTPTRRPPTRPPGGCSPARAPCCAPAGSCGSSATATSATTSNCSRLFGNCEVVTSEPEVRHPAGRPDLTAPNSLRPKRLLNTSLPSERSWCAGYAPVAPAVLAGPPNSGRPDDY